MAVETFDNGTTCFSKANNETKWNVNLEFRQISHKIDCYLYVHPWSSWNGQCLNITPLKIWLGHQKLFPDTMGQNITKKKKKTSGKKLVNRNKSERVSGWAYVSKHKKGAEERCMLLAWFSGLLAFSPMKVCNSVQVCRQIVTVPFPYLMGWALSQGWINWIYGFFFLTLHLDGFPQRRENSLNGEGFEGVFIISWILSTIYGMFSWKKKSPFLVYKWCTTPNIMDL